MRGSGRAERRAPAEPLLALVVDPEEGAALRVLVRALAPRVEVRALGRCDEVPAAILASGPAAARRAPRGIPLAFVHGDELDVQGTMLPLPAAGLDVGAVNARGPLVRARWRERLGLAADLVVFADELTAAERAEALSVCAVAVVGEGDLPLALALGTPVVTDAASAAALGLDLVDQADLPVVIARIGVDAAHVAADLVADEVASARLGRLARTYTEAHLDLAGLATEVLRLLGVAEPAPESSTMELRLAELRLPAVSALRRRVADATSLLSGAAP